ncbi:MAG: hypothetical protein HY652_14310 [Acidobacteria bacterium]|nr:hypothetical protein [Acidobacteriota bacterium]
MAQQKRLQPYKTFLDKWLPGAKLREDWTDRHRAVTADGFLTRRGPGGRLDYVIEEKRHLAAQDAHWIAARLRELWIEPNQGRTPALRLLVLTPFIRPQQANILVLAGVDYLDLAGNAHLEGPGLYVHVEGKVPQKLRATAPGTVTKGWVRIAMALLIRPDAAVWTHRELAKKAGVALGTVGGVLRDLRARGFFEGTRGRRRVGRREELVTVWVQAYNTVLRPKLGKLQLQVRVREKEQLWKKLQAVLGAHGIRWSLTGADAACLMDQFFRDEITQLYADPMTFAKPVLAALDAQPDPRGGNVHVVEPPGPLALEARTVQGVPCAPLLLTYAELRYQDTDRAREAADLLMPRIREAVA